MLFPQFPAYRHGIIFASLLGYEKQAFMNPFSPTITILSAMITPVVLILASGQLIMTTSNRLSRVVDRTRKLMDWIKELVKTNATDSSLESEVAVLFEQLHKNSRRAKLLTRAMSTLYITLSIFVATSFVIGIVDISRAKYTWLPVAFGIIGAGLLFYASILLIKESRIALSAVNTEMDSAVRYVYNKYPSLKK